MIQNYIFKAVGCLGPWEADIKNSSCKSGKVKIEKNNFEKPKNLKKDLMKLEATQKELSFLSLFEIGEKTGCYRPCTYRTYAQFQAGTQLRQ